MCLKFSGLWLRCFLWPTLAPVDSMVNIRHAGSDLSVGLMGNVWRLLPSSIGWLCRPDDALSRACLGFSVLPSRQSVFDFILIKFMACSFFYGRYVVAIVALSSLWFQTCVFQRRLRVVVSFAGTGSDFCNISHHVIVTNIGGKARRQIPYSAHSSV